MESMLPGPEATGVCPEGAVPPHAFNARLTPASEPSCRRTLRRDCPREKYCCKSMEYAFFCIHSRHVSPQNLMIKIITLRIVPFLWSPTMKALPRRCAPLVLQYARCSEELCQIYSFALPFNYRLRREQTASDVRIAA